MELCNYPCPNKTRYYEIEAIQIPIVYNRFGDHDPNGLLYVLKMPYAFVKERYRILSRKSHNHMKK